MQERVRRERRAYRKRALVDSATRLRHLPSSVTLDMAADLIESVWSLRDAGDAALVRRAR